MYVYILGFEPAKVGFEFRKKNLYTHIYTHLNVVHQMLFQCNKIYNNIFIYLFIFKE